METIDKPASPFAGSSPDDVTPILSHRVCLLPVNQEYLVIELSSLCQVIEVKGITTVPGMPHVLAGVTTCRGAVIPLVDLRVLLDWSRASVPRYAAVVRHGVIRFGILIDDVPEIQTVEGGDGSEQSYGKPSHNRHFGADFVNVTGKRRVRLELSALLATIESLPARPAVGSG